MKRNKKSAIPKDSQLFKILQGVSIEEIDKARGSKSQFIRKIDKAATKIELVDLKG